MSDLTQSRFGDVIFTDISTICGVRLKPFCLGHLILLETLNNPIISKEVVDVDFEESIGHFFIALLVCGLTYEEAVLLLTDDKILKEELKLFCDNLAKNMELEPGWNVPMKLSLFKEYMERYLDIPFYDEKTKSNGESPSGTDWKSSIFIIFKKLGYSESDILNMPLNKLFLTWTAYAEGEGAIKVCNKYEAEGIRNTLKQFGKK